MPKDDPLQATDDDARDAARHLMRTASHASLGVLDDTGAPVVTRIAMAPGSDGLPLGLVSDLSLHTQALRLDPRCSLLIGDPGPHGDPLTHPRLTLMATAHFVRHGAASHAELAAQITRHRPKTKLYIGFADFSILRFTLFGGLLNAGFGKAYRLTPDDLGTPA